MAGNWSGSAVRKSRANWAARLPVPCSRCGKPVMPGSAWHVDHWPIPREMGGTETWPAHALCNMSAGGKRGAEITNGRREPVKTARLEERPLAW